MVIGTKSTSTIFDVLDIGIKEHIREVGYPEEIHYKTDGCEFFVSGKDFDNKIDALRVIFKPRRVSLAMSCPRNCSRQASRTK